MPGTGASAAGRRLTLVRDHPASQTETGPAIAPVVWLADLDRARIVWADAGLLAVLGLPDLGALRRTPAHDALLAAGRSTGDLVLQAGNHVVHGAVTTTPIVLPDGRLGRRVVWSVERPDADETETLRAAAFDAAPLPLAVEDADGRLCAANAAYQALDPAGRPPRHFRRIALPGRPGHALLAGEPGGRTATAGITAEALARIAHEFRSPLTAVLGFAEFLRVGLTDMPAERAQGYLDDLATAADRMRRLADALVALGDGQSGLQIAEIALDPALEDVMRLMAPAAERRGIALSPPAPSGLRVLADGDALSRAVLNLVDNAVRHAAQTVRVAVEDAGRDGGAAILVADDGPGLDPAALQQALQPYGRADAAADAAPGGLGLPIVREIAEAHGGRLVIEAAPGQGLAARLHLPPGRVFRTPSPIR